MKVLSEKEMPLLARKRIKFEVLHPETSTPKKENLKADVAKQYNVAPELVSIRHVYGKFGRQKSKIIAHIYKDEKTMKFLETPKGKKAGAAPAAK
jgi:small subunit ribosomal protein S24e